MRAQEFHVYYPAMDVDDDTLKEMYKDMREELSAKQCQLAKAKQTFDENNYESLLVAQLHYRFCKEEYRKILYEVEKRKLLIG